MNVMVLDKDLNVIAVVDFYESCIWTDRYNSYGDFELYISDHVQNLSIFQADNYITHSDSEHAMIIDTMCPDTNTEDGNFITITGYSLESILSRRIIWKQTTISGNLQNGIKQLLDENIISPTDESRKISNFIFEYSTDTAITELTIGSAQFTGDNLYDVIQCFCKIFNLGFKITINDNRQFVFRLYAGADRSYSQTENPYVTFSPSFDNLVSSKFSYSKRTYKNVSLVGGEGEGTARKYVTVGTASGIDRREYFTDARDISSTVSESSTAMTTAAYEELLTERGSEKLADFVETSKFDAEIEDNKLYAYNRDFFNGDIIELDNGYGMSRPTRITEITMSEDKNGYSIYPTFEIKQLEEE